MTQQSQSCVLTQERLRFMSTQTSASKILIAALIIQDKLETIPVSHNRGLNKQTVIHPYNEPLLSNKKWQISDTLKNISGSQMHYAEWVKPDSKVHIVWFHLYDVLAKAKLSVVIRELEWG